MRDSYFEHVYALVATIPYGKVASYGQIAQALDGCHSGRIVGYALRAAPADRDLPCHRVVNRFGGLAPPPAFGAPGRQRALLEAEGVVFTAEGCVDMQQCRHILPYEDGPAF